MAKSMESQRKYEANECDMIWERDVVVENISYRVVISDEAETLLAAKAAGRVVVGCLGKDGKGQFPMARYLVETVDVADEHYLERVIRREKGLPWRIGESGRLRLREFVMEDIAQIPMEPSDEPGDQVFYDPEKLAAYIRSQYGFLEYGLWAVERKEDGKILGKAGITDCDTSGDFELAYHIFLPYRRQGYGKEACRIVLNYVKKEYSPQGVYAVIEASNDASAGLLKKLGFTFQGSECSGERHRYCLGGLCY